MADTAATSRVAAFTVFVDVAAVATVYQPMRLFLRNKFIIPSLTFADLFFFQ